MTAFAKRAIKVIAANRVKAIAAVTALSILGVYIDPKVADAVVTIAQIVGLML